MGRRESAHLDPVLGTTSHHIGRNDAVTDYAGPAVDVFQEEVQRLYALGQPRLEMQPIGTRNYPRQTVNGNRPLLGLLVPVHRKCNAFVRKRARNPVLDVDQLLLGEQGSESCGPACNVPGGRRPAGTSRRMSKDQGRSFRISRDYVESLAESSHTRNFRLKFMATL